MKTKSLNIRKIKKLYLGIGCKKHSAQQIGDIFGVSETAIRKRLNKARVKLRTISEAMRIAIGSDGYVDRSGYRRVPIDSSSPFWPMAYKQLRAGGVSTCGMIKEHRLAMAMHLGRCLEEWEIVHHKNHNRLDNRIENLELISRSVEHAAETIAHQNLIKFKSDNIQLMERINKTETFRRVLTEAYRDGRISVNETPEQSRERYLKSREKVEK